MRYREKMRSVFIMEKPSRDCSLPVFSGECWKVLAEENVSRTDAENLPPLRNNKIFCDHNWTMG